MDALPPRELTLSAKPRFTDRVGLLAGSGRFPVYFAESAARQGIAVCCVALRDMADPVLPTLVQRCHWVGIGKLGRILQRFRQMDVKHVVMAGKVPKAIFFSPWQLLNHLPDWRMIRVGWNYLRHRADNRDDTMLLNLVREFQRDGMEVASALEICPELLVKAGILTRRLPTNQECRDIGFGWQLAKEMGRLDVGQTVIVKKAAVLAVEAIEGTDQAILRAGSLCPSGGFVVVKVAKPEQDMRFDVPTIGSETIRILHQAGGRVLAIEADRTILLDQEETVALANRLNMSIVSLHAAQAFAWQTQALAS